MELHQNVEKFLHLQGKVVENSILAPQFLPSPRPNLPAITDSPEGGANLLVGGANLLVTAVDALQKAELAIRTQTILLISLGSNVLVYSYSGIQFNSVQLS